MQAIMNECGNAGRCEIVCKAKMQMPRLHPFCPLLVVSTTQHFWSFSLKLLYHHCVLKYEKEEKELINKMAYK